MVIWLYLKEAVELFEEYPDIRARFVKSVQADIRGLQEENTRLEIELEENKERIFGGLLDLLAKALQILPFVKIEQEDLPRMADFSYLGEAV